MYLKSIEVQGFKSFANKIKFEFHNGITGIVGPNGSGKSNVGDAVRWVLGEQKVKQLRSGSMQDVIFSGTETRKPLSYASVAITLDNSDHQLPVSYEEVTVTRKLYRSGESEYLINGRACRLKDINEMFYDTGIGKEGYSIIGQGQIDKILSGKPEERRELFEEAAGIVKYKRRKRVSVKKLEDEKQNLVRVTDILSELEKQIGPLGRQSEKAREYLKRKEELKIYDINMFLLETARIEKQLSETQEKLGVSNEEMEQAVSALEKLKAEYEETEEAIEELDDQIEDSKDQLNKSTLLKQQLENQIEILKEQINSAKMNDEHYAVRSQAIVEEIAKRENQKIELEEAQKDRASQLHTLKQNEEAAGKLLTGIQEQIMELNSEIEAHKQEIIELLNHRASTREQIQHYKTMLEQIEISKSRIHQQMIETASNILEQKAQYEEYADQMKLITNDIEKLVAEQKEYERTVQRLQEQITAESEKARVSEASYHRERSKLESLKNITERYEGYGGSIRRVMDRKDREPGLLGVVADIIKVEKDYEIAIETALGGSIQNIVTQDENTAKRMIQYLKNNRYGRATFLPLTNLRPGNGIARPEALKEKGVLGTANRLVHVEKHFQVLADFLLGRTVVVDTLDTGTAIARKYRQSLRIVTLEGELINPGGSMTGGAFKNSSNLLSRRREIEELERAVEQLKQEMKSHESAAEDLREERAGFYKKIDAITETLQKAYVVQNTAKMNVEQAKQNMEAAAQNAGSSEKELQELEKQVEEAHENQDSINIELDTSEKLETDLNEQIERYQNDLNGLREEENAEQKNLEDIRVKLASMEQQYEFGADTRERVDEEIVRFQDEKEQIAKNRKDSIAEIEEKETRILDLQRTIGDSEDLFAEIKEEIETCTKQRADYAARNKKVLAEREDMAKRQSDLDKEIFRLESRKEGLESDSEKQMNYMWEEYELTYNRALELRNEEMTNTAELKKHISEVKGQIKALGNVNVNAIEEYKEVSERYTFLKGQYDDLTEASQTLEKIIEELDRAMRKQFKEQFEKIATEYDKVFKELFGGGKGTLELMEDEDILEAGIQITAQPPGKKLQNMMQLSGGEKALTAICLLFAIQNLKPSPFCLLDEIEAALDDSNVERYANYLHKLTKHTQFIVITHRRGTMTAADRLYGITMQEKGVSTLVSVNLIEDELDA